MIRCWRFLVIVSGCYWLLVLAVVSYCPCVVIRCWLCLCDWLIAFPLPFLLLFVLNMLVIIVHIAVQIVVSIVVVDAV